MLSGVYSESARAHLRKKFSSKICYKEDRGFLSWAKRAMSEFVIQLLFDKRSDGRFHVHSPNVPGLHLAGKSIELIRGDIEPVVRDLLFYNSGMVVDQIRWVPSLDEVVKEMAPSVPAITESPETPKFLVITGRAA